MRERAALYDGEVTAGPNGHGGWTVQPLLFPNPPSPESHPARPPCSSSTTRLCSEWASACSWRLSPT
jgi:hypothetical protein